MKRETVIGIAWFRPEQWQRLLAAAADASELETTYEEWERHATKTLKRLRRGGVDVRKVDVNVEELIAWCKEQMCKLDGNARAEYASHRLRLNEQAARKGNA
jgi:hypothetical protein